MRPVFGERSFSPLIQTTMAQEKGVDIGDIETLPMHE
jgi:hypothetical protein